jgi:hypothetical protein
MPVAHAKNPLVLTLTSDKATQSFLTGLRAKYFPPTRNFLNAHVTLFHAIPHHRINELDKELSSVCSSTKAWDVFVGEPRKMGNNGVMVTVRERPSGTIEAIHRDLLSALKKGTREEADTLSNQDLRPLGRPHVTVLNKAKEPEDVDRCLEEVQKLFEDMKSQGQQFGQKVGTAVGY